MTAPKLTPGMKIAKGEYSPERWGNAELRELSKLMYKQLGGEIDKAISEAVKAAISDEREKIADLIQKANCADKYKWAVELLLTQAEAETAHKKSGRS